MAEDVTGVAIRFDLLTDSGGLEYRNVLAERITFVDGDVVAWHRGVEVYRCPVSSVSGLKFEPAARSYLASIRVDHPMANARWMPEEEDQVRALHAAGVPLREMAAQLGRRQGGIRSRLIRLGLIPSPDAGDSAGDEG